MSELSNPEVTVIIPSRNEVSRIERCLRGVLGQDYNNGDFEVIVADGMSNDGTREVLARLQSQNWPFQLVNNPERIVSTGLNAAIRRARGEIILRMDVHTDYAPDYIRTSVSELEKSGADNVGGPARTQAHGLIGRAIAAAYHCPFACGGARFHDVGHEGYVETVPYGCWRKETLERLGLFDETLVRNQDDELNLRLIRSGGTIWQSPRIVSWYSLRSSLSSLFRQYFQYGFWKVPVIRKHHLPASWRHLVPGAFVIGIVLLPVIAVVAQWWGLTGVGVWSSTAWKALIVTYAIGNLVASMLTARSRGWDLAPLLPVVLATFHIAYGLGFAMGLAYWPFRSQDVRHENFFTAINR